MLPVSFDLCTNAAVLGLAAGAMVPLECALPAGLAHQFRRVRNVAASGL